MATVITAVFFDLDDTLFPQAAWLAGAWDAVAAAAEWVDRAALRASLASIAAGGTDGGRIIDRAVEGIGAEIAVGPLVDAFRAHAPATLACYPGAAEAVAAVRRHVPVAL